ncbi:RnfH family protein [Mariprofundus erugo]|uniref:UPF0125 protein FEF65_07030 n=1 Tax=Mariprofundus erugo TaxID=2528639 RepID=A0A5R9GMS0_9PROT|nr:RnfH family protein [Mariprofundus erugo]TLS67661.1 RnfH family protein [Mariprofundus erugo]TLS75635.1 RnfH family protein [Mariprofundus erugo]
MRITVVYALPNEQYLQTFDVVEGTTAEEAVKMCDVMTKHPEINLSANKLGIFGKLVPASQPLQSGDRVEIYRALPRKPRDAHAVEDKKSRIRARKESRGSEDA